MGLGCADWVTPDLCRNAGPRERASAVPHHKRRRHRELDPGGSLLPELSADREQAHAAGRHAGGSPEDGGGHAPTPRSGRSPHGMAGRLQRGMGHAHEQTTRKSKPAQHPASGPSAEQAIPQRSWPLGSQRECNSLRPAGRSETAPKTGGQQPSATPAPMPEAFRPFPGARLSPSPSSRSRRQLPRGLATCPDTKARAGLLAHASASGYAAGRVASAPIPSPEVGVGWACRTRMGLRRGQGRATGPSARPLSN